MREIISFDRDWRFYIGDIQPDTTSWGFIKSGTYNQNGASLLVEDSSWEQVNLPHDFMIGEAITPSKELPESRKRIPSMDYMGICT